MDDLPDLLRHGSIVVEQRLATGSGDQAGMAVGVLGAGMRFRLSPTFEVHALTLALRSAGTPAEAASGDERPTEGGFGGELGIRVAPLPQWPVRPYAFGSTGLLLFPGRPFLPGGDAYEFMISFGVGAETDLGEGWRVGVRGFAVHLSNGQGLGEHNPAYDGFGGAVDVSWALDPRARVASPWADEGRGTEPRARAAWLPGVAAEGYVGEAGDLLAGGRVRAVERLFSPRALAVLDVEGASLAAEPLVEAGLGLVGHVGLVTLGLHGGWRRFVGVDAGVATAQVEAHATPEVSLVAMGHREWSEGFGNLWRAGVGARAYPLRSLVIELGLGFDRIGDDDVFEGDRVDPYMGVEWATPIAGKAHCLSLFVERQVSTVSLAGVRLVAGAGRTPREFARREGWRRLR